MRGLIVAAMACLLSWTGTARAQFYSSIYGYGAPLVIGYRYPFDPYSGYPLGGYGMGYVYTWPYYLETPEAYFGPYIAPPLYVPPEQLGFGPQAVRQFMGIDSTPPRIVNQNILISPPAANGNINEKENAAQNAAGAARRRVRQSNAEARQRGQQFLTFGDKQFQARDLAGAYDRYRKAAEATPDLAEPYFRMGHTLADLGRYQQAATAFRRGLGLSPDWPQSGFVLADLYGGNQAARNAALDNVERAAAANPDDASMQFAAGVQYYFHGRPAEARVYLQRAMKLGESAASVDPFLKSNRPAEDAELDI